MVFELLPRLIAGRLYSLEAERQLVRFRARPEGVVQRHLALLVEFHEGLVERLHRVRGNAVSHYLRDQGGFFGIDDAVPDGTRGHQYFDRRDTAGR